MKPIVNHTYKVEFQKTHSFEWKRYNSIVDLTEYEPKIVPILHLIAPLLIKQSRQVVIPVNSLEFNSCLLTLQFQLVDNTFYITANYRSQCAVNGKPNDENMLKYIATKVLEELEFWNPYEDYKVDITVQVGNFHINASAK